MDDAPATNRLPGDPPGLAEGATVLHGRYRLVRLLGRGAMGAVWLAEDLELEENRALKFVAEFLCDDAEELGLLRREAAQSQKLTHPNIVRVYDFVRDGHHAALAMEFIDGRNLKQLRAESGRGFFDVAVLREWVGQLLEALHYAHAFEGVVHRDLKPANVMVRNDGVVKVTDFGIAQAVGATLTRVNRLASPGGTLGTSGTPAYMSPQQVMGAEVTEADDIYSLGSLLHDLLTGHPPFFRGEILTQLLHKAAPTVTAARAEAGIQGVPVPAQWDATIAECLAKEPEDRPASISEVAQRLGFGPMAEPTAPTVRRAWTTAASGRKRGAARPRADGGGERAAAARETVGEDARRGRIVVLLVMGALLLAGLAWMVSTGLFVPLGDDVAPERPAAGGTGGADDPAPPDPPDPVELARAEGREALAEGRFGDAAEAFGTVLAEEPDDLEAMRGKLEADQALGQDSAILAGTAALLARVDVPLAERVRLTVQRAQVLRRGGDLEAALGALDDAVAIAGSLTPAPGAEPGEEPGEGPGAEPGAEEPEVLGAAELAALHRERAYAKLDLGRTEEAVVDLVRVVRLEPGILDGWLDLCELHLQLRQFRDARDAATEAIAIDPTSADAYNYRGTANHFLGLYPQAIEDFNRALALRPGFSEAQANLDETLAARRMRQTRQPAPERKGLRGLFDFFKPRRD